MNALTPDEMKSADTQTVDDVGVPQIILMEAAGRAVADIARDFIEELEGDPIRVAVVAGPGNNGADALVAARHLFNLGFEPDIYMAESAERCNELCRVQLEIVESLGASISFLSEQSIEFFRSGLRSASLVIDGLLGIGAQGAPREPYRDWVNEINAAGREVVAVDIPTGIDASTGQVPGSAVSASVTVTMAAPKIGMLLYPAASYVGELWVANIGIPPAILAEAGGRYNVMTKEQFLYWLPQRSPLANKRTAGDVVVIGGSSRYPGAPALAAIGAQYAGAGYVTVACPSDAAEPIGAKLVEQVLAPWPADAAPDEIVRALLETTRHAGAVIIGPGLGRSDSVQSVVRGFIEASPRPLVIDADALYALGGHAEIIDGKRAVLTPHDGEFAHLLGDSADAVVANRIRAVDQFAAAHDTTVLLKGPRSIVATDDASYINLTGNELLATAGTGDVLSGITGAMLAAGCTPRQAASIGAYWHGITADFLREEQKKHSIVAGDVARSLADALHWLEEREEENDGYLLRLV